MATNPEVRRAWMERTKDVRYAKHKAWLVKNRDRVLAKRREREATPASKAKKAVRARASYLRNCIKIKTYRDQRYREDKDYLEKIKSQPCLDCGRSYPSYVMDFDHRDPTQKVDKVSHLLSKGKVRLREELAKCDLICANCHRERTHGPKTRLVKNG